MHLDPRQFPTLLLTFALVACTDGSDDLSGLDESTETGDANSDETGAPSESPLIEFTLDGSPSPVTIDHARVVVLHAEPLDPGVKHVSFFADGELIASDAEPPFEAFWIASDESLNGEHVFSALAVDDESRYDEEDSSATLELPPPGTLQWTRASDAELPWRQILASPEGPILLGKGRLSQIDSSGAQLWSTELGFEASHMSWDSGQGGIVLVGAEGDEIVVSQTSRLGEMRSIAVLEEAGSELELTGIAIRDDRLLVAGSEVQDGTRRAWSALISMDLGADLELLWIESGVPPKSGSSLAASPALLDDGGFVVPHNRAYGGAWSVELRKYDASGQLEWTETDDSSDKLSVEATLVDDGGDLHVAGLRFDGGWIERRSSDGEWLSAYATLGASVDVLGFAWEDVVWAGNTEESDIQAGRVAGSGAMQWRTTIERLELFDERPVSIAADELGYVYVLTATLGGEGRSRVYTLHP